MKFRKFWIYVFIFYIAASHAKYSTTAAQARGVNVSGRLLNVEGAPFNDRSTRALLRLGNGVAGVSNIGFDGGFEFTNIPPGNYSLSVSGREIPLSPIIPVRVADTEVRDIEMIVPRAKQVSGQVVLEGKGPLPQVLLQLKPVKDPTANPAVKALSPSGFVTNDALPGLIPIFPAVDLNPRTDGTFVARIPDGDWTVTVSGELPSGYAIKILTYGTTDILHGPLKVRMSEDAAIRLVATNSTNRPSTVYGRITGLTPEMIARGPITLSVRGPMSPTRPGLVSAQPRTAALRADGTFEVDEVLPGDYSVMVTGLDNLALAIARLFVAKTDVRDFEIEIPRTEIRGQIVVEGTSALPILTLGFKKVQERGGVVGGEEGLNVAIRPRPDGTFSALFPPETALLHANDILPCGYKLKSVIYGGTDVLRLPLKVLKADTSPQLQITLTYSECVRR